MAWFRMHAEFVDDPKVQRLSPEIFKFWVNCLGLTSQNGGHLPSVSDMAWKLKLSENKVAAGVAHLQEAGLLDQSDELLAPHNWEARQYKSDVSTERVRRFRNNKETLQKLNGNVSETPPDTDTDTDTDTEHIKPPNPHAPDGACAVAPLAIRRPSKGKRGTEEIRKALGPRQMWWEEFWKTFPCHDGMNQAMDAFERVVTTIEIYKAVIEGARRYAAKARSDPNLKLKFGQGWINDARWTDENAIAAPTEKGFAADVARVIGGRMARGEPPW